MVSMTLLLLLLIIDINVITNEMYANAIINNNDNLNYKLQTGTQCSDKTNQLSLFPNGTSMPDPPRCWFLPDFGEPISNLVGTTGPDLIYGREGLDVLQGKAGDDILDGGNDNDSIFGDDGNDDLFGSFGDDSMFSGNGDDMIDGSFGNDYLIGGNGNDELFGGQGNDILKGGAGSDFFDCGDNIDVVLDFNSIEGDTMSETCENSKKGSQ
jgi:Ca2+-binding RTX toxin-like protein